MRDSTGRWCLIGGLVLIVVSAFVGGAARGANAHANYRAVCAPPVLGSVHCHSAVVVDGNGNPQVNQEVLSEDSDGSFEDITETSARGVCTVLVEGEMRTGETMHAAAYYDDVYERVDDTWKFKSRTVYPLTTPQLGSLVS